MPYALFVDSNNSVSLYPEYDFVNDRQKIESRHRTPTGKQWTYTWGEFDRFQFSVKYVNSSDMSIVNSWWESNTDLLFMEEGGSSVFSVHIISDNKPIGKFIKPYTDLFQGVIILEGY